MWMPPHTTRPPFFTTLSAAGDSAETKNSKPTPLPCQAIAAPADQPGTQPRRDLGSFAPLAERKTISRIGDGMSGIAAVARITGENRRIAQILGAGPAIGTRAAGRTQPRHPDPLADRNPATPRPESGDPTNPFVARYDR